MQYVYLIKSLSWPKQKYVGLTEDIDKRMREHNAGDSPHTKKFKPWELVTFIAFKERSAIELDHDKAHYDLVLRNE